LNPFRMKNEDSSVNISAEPAFAEFSGKHVSFYAEKNPPDSLEAGHDVHKFQSATNGDGKDMSNGPAHSNPQRSPSHMESDLEKSDDAPRTTEWGKLLFCWGNYEAPEARPWVLMHAVVGICIIHFSIAIAQAILYTASAVADANQRMPSLFYIRAGNTQIAVNIIVSIINIALLPTIGAISDYTRYRYHVGCVAILAVCASEFVSAAASQEVKPNPPHHSSALHMQHPPLILRRRGQLFGLMMGTSVAFGICFQIWFMSLRIAYITEMSTTKVPHHPPRASFASRVGNRGERR
jgi:hypothetical protein